MKKIKVGIAGSRGLSTVMGLRALPDVEITALCNLDEATLDAQAKDLGVEHKYRVFEDMLASDIDAVIIATPMQCHVPQAIAALEAGKHVMSEVTAGVTMDELWWLCEAVEKSGKIYMPTPKRPPSSFGRKMTWSPSWKPTGPIWKRSGISGTRRS